MPVGSQVLARHRKVSWSVSSCTHCEHNIPDLIDCDLSIHDTIKVCVCVCVCVRPCARANQWRTTKVLKKYAEGNKLSTCGCQQCVSYA